MLDTATLMFLDAGSSRLSETARSAIADPANELFMSVVNAWELYIKTALRRLTLPEPVVRFNALLERAYGITSLALRDEDLKPLATLPLRHRDPFDRALIAQSIARNLVIVTPDKTIRAYPEVRSIW